MKKTMIILMGIFAVAMLSAAVTSNQPTQVKPVSGVNFTTSAVVSGEFPTPAGRMVAVVINKTGAAVGHAYLQGSNDGVSWKDINSGTNPGASGTFAAGTAAIMLNAEANAWARVRFLLREGGTNTGVIVGGKWISK